MSIKSLLKIFFISGYIFSQSAANPNIVLIVSDDHGTNDLGCYGNTKISTPNLDKLAEESFRFTNAYSAVSSCTASRSVILTGLYNHATGLYGLSHHTHHFRAFEELKSLPVLLEELANYSTARIGKYHVAPEEVFRFQTALPGNSRICQFVNIGSFKVLLTVTT
jgi:N-sulfoglucosamine sulfohydrolase